MAQRLLICGLLLLATAAAVYAESPRQTTKEGIRLYENEEYDKALAEFLTALEGDPDRKETNYNVATALYKLDDYEKAIGAMSRALEDAAPGLAADAWYNLGNALVKNGKMKEAVAAYKNSLRKRHDDEDAKYNLETALRMMQMQQQQQQQQQSDQQDSTQQQKQEQQQQQQQKQEQEQNEQQQQQQQQMAEGDSLNQQPQSQEPTDMSEEEALQLLQALEADEQEAQQEKLKRQFGEPKRVEKDW